MVVITKRTAVITSASMLLVTLVTIAIVVPVVLTQNHTSKAAVACNGNTALCNRSWSSVSLVGAHDSPFVGELPQENQELSVTEQLDAGIRFLQGQTHKNVLGELSMCHTNCFLLDSGTTESYLSTVKSWLDSNPNQVLTLLLTNGDSVDPSLFDTAFTDSGIKKYAFVPSTSPNTLPVDAWPTLQQLIDSGKRLVVFLDYGADEKRFPYILNEFNYYFETPFDTTDPKFPQCTLDRPAGISPNGRMYIVNHFLDLSIFGILIPDRAALEATNAATGTGSIGAQADLCKKTYGRTANVVLVDYMNYGDVFAAQNSLNGL